MEYWRPIVADPAEGGLPLAGGPLRFTRVERLERGRSPEVVPALDVPGPVQERLCGPRPPLCGLDLATPRIMGILNVTPDSFSDGGAHVEDAADHAREMIAAGADIVDVGGESTRPGAREVPVAEEVSRIRPVIEALRGAGAPVSIDTRKAEVAEAAHAAGAVLFNDVSAFTFTGRSLAVGARFDAVCLMHAQGDPATMQDAPEYENVLLDVYDFLEERIGAAEAAGISRGRILADPGIGFGKTLGHNLDLMAGLSLFHGLGCPILVGASRKRFIGTLSGEADAARRGPGSIAAALEAVRQGVQVVRVHDVAETRAALDVWAAMHGWQSRNA